MKKTAVLLSVVLVMLLAGAAGLFALGLDVEFKAGGGMAMGTTDDPDKSGQVRWALNTDLVMDLFLLETPRTAFGFSFGAGYANMHYHGVWENLVDPYDFTSTVQTSDSAYNYLMFPVSVVSRTLIVGERALTVRAGAFAGYFLGGTSDLSYDPETTAFTNGKQTLDDSNTEQWMYGLSFYVGLDVLSRGRLTIVPSLKFDLGLTDTSTDLPFPPASKDTFWAFTANVGIRYSLLK
jgi:hypothetical protein